ncbi:MAG TPA: peptide chain release factor N(5)-glutamine methyltransferase [Gammaproteobacteria bacterium]
MPTRTFNELLADATSQLAAISDSARLDAELLLARAIDRPRSHLRAWPENRPDAEQAAQFEALLSRRIAGEPMAYILGEREFWSLRLAVSPDTLIPRPDTEILVETALEKIPRDSPCRVLDLGTGTGAIALALKQERPLAELHASDASTAALAIARGNAEAHKLDIHFHAGDWWAPFSDQTFDVIVSNPPYIAANDAHLDNGDVRFEPRTALASGADGLDDIRKIIAGARHHLAPCGWLLLEHGHDQAQAVGELLTNAGFEDIGCRKDFSGNDRVSLGKRRPL